jgi:hypothetical protein
LSSASTVPAGSLLNASSVDGERTLPFSVSTRPAASIAATGVVNDPAETAVSTMSALRLRVSAEATPPAKANTRPRRSKRKFEAGFMNTS